MCRLQYKADSLLPRGHLVTFQSTTLQGQAGIAQELCRRIIYTQASLVHIHNIVMKEYVPREMD